MARNLVVYRLSVLFVLALNLSIYLCVYINVKCWHGYEEEGPSICIARRREYTSNALSSLKLGGEAVHDVNSTHWTWFYDNISTATVNLLFFSSSVYTWHSWLNKFTVNESNFQFTTKKWVSE